jgi:hypothetical protein
LVWNFFVVSKKYEVNNFAPKARSPSSDILKKAVKTKIRNTGRAAIAPSTLFHHSSHPHTVLKTTRESEIPIAMINICTRVIVNGPIERCILKIHLVMLLGKITFIRKSQLLSKERKKSLRQIYNFLFITKYTQRI